MAIPTRVLKLLYLCFMAEAWADEEDMQCSIRTEAAAKRHEAADNLHDGLRMCSNVADSGRQGHNVALC